MTDEIFVPFGEDFRLGYDVDLCELAIDRRNSAGEWVLYEVIEFGDTPFDEFADAVNRIQDLLVLK